MFQNLQKPVLVSLFFGLIVGAPVRLVAQDREPPDGMTAVMEVVNDVKLGLQVRGGIRGVRQKALPLKNRTVQYLQRPMAGDLSYSIPYYGVGLALRFRGAEVALAFQGGGGLTGSTHWLRFRDGTDAIPFKPSYKRGIIRAEYFVRDWIGVGVFVQGSGIRISSQCSECDFRINGAKVKKDLFRAHSAQRTYSLYVPVRKEWGNVQFFGRIGASIFGRSVIETYRPDFVMYQDPEQPGTPTDPSAPTLGMESDESSRPDVNRQFGRVGVGVPLGEIVTVRAFIGGERLSVSGLTKRWSYEAGLEVGFPF